MANNLGDNFLLQTVLVSDGNDTDPFVHLSPFVQHLSILSCQTINFHHFFNTYQPALQSSSPHKFSCTIITKQSMYIKTYQRGGTIYGSIEYPLNCMLINKYILYNVHNSLKCFIHICNNITSTVQTLH